MLPLAGFIFQTEKAPPAVRGSSLVLIGCSHLLCWHAQHHNHLFLLIISIHFIIIFVPRVLIGRNVTRSYIICYQDFLLKQLSVKLTSQFVFTPLESLSADPQTSNIKAKHSVHFFTDFSQRREAEEWDAHLHFSTSLTRKYLASRSFCRADTFKSHY